MTRVTEVVRESPPEADGGHAPITALLQAWRRGEPDAAQALLPQGYLRLHRLAERAVEAEDDGADDA